jgi:hypothetical protein
LHARYTIVAISITVGHENGRFDKRRDFEVKDYRQMFRIIWLTVHAANASGNWMGLERIWNKTVYCSSAFGRCCNVFISLRRNRRRGCAARTPAIAVLFWKTQYRGRLLCIPLLINAHLNNWKNQGKT